MFFLVFLLVTVLELDLGVKPFKRGFFCNDKSLSKPYRDSTVPTFVVICVGTGLNLMVVSWMRTMLIIQSSQYEYAEIQQNDFFFTISKQLFLASRGYIYIYTHTLTHTYTHTHTAYGSRCEKDHVGLWSSTL